MNDKSIARKIMTSIAPKIRMLFVIASYSAVIFDIKKIASIPRNDVLHGGFRKNMRILGAIGIAGTLFACIEEFNPELEVGSSFLVVDGSIIKENSVQKVIISRSVPINETGIEYVSGCEVWVSNKQGSEFPFTESEPGNYTTIIPDNNLQYNEEFRLHIITPEGEEYESTYEPILESSPVDSVYFGVTSFQSSAEEHSEGYQFFTDLKAPNTDTRNYRWIVEETWEYRTKYLIAGFYDNNYKKFIEYEGLEQLKYHICYKTETVKELYSATTANLVINEKKQIPLNYVPATSTKFNYKYSILVKQFALSDKAYTYWNQNKVQISESGGLYQTQPSQSQSNIKNVNNPEETVLGYFWASSYSDKRILLEPKYYTEPPGCTADTIDIESMQDINRDAYIAVLGYYDPFNVILGLTSQYCVDCREQGGKTEVPEFWK